jgi:hypothetical protein
MGPTGPTGETGPTGPTGEVGPTGAIGLTGPVYDFSPTYINAYSTTVQTIATEQSISFDGFTSKYGSCGHLPGDIDVWVWQPGSYHIITKLHHVEPCQFSLFLNGQVVVGAIYSSPTGSSQNANSIILDIYPSDISQPTNVSPTGFGAKLNVANHTSYAPIIEIDGVGGAGSAGPDITAIMTVFLLRSFPPLPDYVRPGPPAPQ